MERRIILAAGHGGGDPGATGQGTTEAAEVIDIVNRAAEKIKADGQVEVVVVPHELNLIDEINWVNQRYQSLNQGYALEVHKNAAVGGHGIEGWFFHDDVASQHLMKCIDDGVVRATGLPARGEKPDTSNRWGRLGWVEDTNTSAGLLEAGFITNGGDPVGAEANNRYAQGIFEGVLAIWGLSPVPAPVVKVPAQVQVAYRVYAGDKQIGAYTKDDNAWNKYAVEGGTKIVNSDGADVTAQFVLKYRPIVATPDNVVSAPHPTDVIAEVSDVAKRVGILEAIIQKIKDLLAKWGIVL